MDQARQKRGLPIAESACCFVILCRSTLINDLDRMLSRVPWPPSVGDVLETGCSLLSESSDLSIPAKIYLMFVP